jgi:hypothetical protein
MVHDIFYVSKHAISKYDWNEFRNRYPTAIKVEYAASFDDVKTKSFTKMFWIVWNDLEILEDFKFDYVVPKWDMNYIHVFKNDKFFDGVVLYPRHIVSSDREFFNRYYIEKKEIPILASTPKLYNIQHMIKTYDDYLKILVESPTEMFWFVPDDVVVADDFKFDIFFTYDNEYDRKMNHVFLNGNSYDGIMLMSKHSPVSKKEFENRFPIERKEWDIVASTPKPYDKFYVDTYDQYLEAIDSSFTELCWTIPNDVVSDDFKFDIYFEHSNTYDRKMNHVFLNGDEYTGIMLMSKHKPITQREFEHRFLIERKEWDIVASTPKPYDKFYVDTYDDYIEAKNLSSTEMFWVIPNDVVVADDFKFDIYFKHSNIYDRKMNHVFLNGDEYTGIMLMSKHSPVSKKEFENRFPIERKEWDIVASTPKPYDKFVIGTYDDYIEAKHLSSTEMFWVIPKEVEVLDFDFNLCFSYHDRIERKMNHVFQHKFRNELTYNGLILTSKNVELSKKEVDFRYPITKKEYTILASRVIPYDIVFISYNEPTADENYTKLLERFPRAKRVHGIKGIHNAHILAAKSVDTEMFWAVDGDAIIDPDFNFDYEVSRYETDIVHVWQSRNPINNLIYGYGGIKLLPTKLTVAMNNEALDMTTSISKRFKPMPEISNISSFDIDEFNTWKSAFRECVKLSSQLIDRRDSTEDAQRLHVWQTHISDHPFNKYAILGARSGHTFGTNNKDNISELKKINDFDWLQQEFKKINE